MANDQKTQPQTQQPKPATAAPPPEKSWLDQATEYLKSSGWEMLGMNEMGVGIWQDPAGSRQRATPSTVIELPATGGGTETVRQMTGPPIPWQYTTPEAMWVQQERDKKGTAATPLQRLEKLEQQLGRLADAHQRLVHAVEKVVQMPPSNKPETQTAMRGLLIDALAAARAA